MNSKHVAAIRHSEYKDLGLKDLLTEIYAKFDNSDYSDYYTLIYYKFTHSNNSIKYAYQVVDDLPTEIKDLYIKVVMMFILTSGIRKNQVLFIPDYFKALSKVYEKNQASLIEYVYKQKIFNEPDIKLLFKASHQFPILDCNYKLTFQIEKYEYDILFSSVTKYLDVKITTAILYDYNLKELAKLQVKLEYINFPQIQISTTNPHEDSLYLIDLNAFYFDNSFKGFGANIYVKSENGLNFNGYLTLPINPIYSESYGFWSYFKELLKSEYSDLSMCSVNNPSEKYMIPLKLKN